MITTKGNPDCDDEQSNNKQDKVEHPSEMVYPHSSHTLKNRRRRREIKLKSRLLCAVWRYRFWPCYGTW
jgi:hypothetical protein